MPRRRIEFMPAVVLSIACCVLWAAPAAYAADRYALEFDGVDDYVEIPTEDYIFEDGDTFTIETWARWFDDTRSLCGYRYSFQRSRFRTRGSAALTVMTGITNEEWHHVAAVYRGDGATRYLDLYVNGAHTASTTTTGSPLSSYDGNMLRIGMTRHSSGQYSHCIMDEIRIWECARTEMEIQENMGQEISGSEEGLIGYWRFNEGQGTVVHDSSPRQNHGTVEGATWTTDAAPVLPGAPPTSAQSPSPANGAVDVPRDVVLGWAPGAFADTHDVYFGASFEEVEGADRANPMGVLLSQRQNDSSYDPAGLLDFETTYYWRVDEVNAPPDAAIYRGDVWSFTTEPVAYAIQDVMATASHSDVDAGPENTVDGAGLNGNDQHSIDGAHMWLTPRDTELPVWIQYEFDRVYKLHELAVWNYNVMFESVLGFGLKDVTIEYSIDGADWVVLADVQFAQATARADYAANTVVDLEGVAARFVRLNVNSGWGTMSQYGLSEVRFTYIPAQAREPQPADGASDVDPDTTLSWRAGREAVSHEVYFGTNPDDLPMVGTVAQASFAPDALDFGTTYCWRIDAVSDGVWAGDLWSFSTLEYQLIEGFESYTDDIDAGEAIFDTWLDGWVNETGSTVGYLEAPFAERTIVRSGRQSMPLFYDNTDSPFYSETSRSFDSVQNWTVNGADTLRLFVAGVGAAFYEADDGAIVLTGAGTDIWDNSDEFRYAYKSLSGDGSMTVRVLSNGTGTNAWAKGGVMIRQNLDAGAINVMGAVTGGDGDGGTFQWRSEANGDSDSSRTLTGIAPPYWVRLTRQGNIFTVEMSADGEQWQQQGDNPVTIAMQDPVLIGLAVTSHASGELRTFEFDSVSTTGNVTGNWQVADVGVEQPEGNAPAPLYVALEDANGRTAVVTHPNASIIGRSGWNEWQIPLSDFADVNLSRIDTMTIGVGSRTSPTAGGTGVVYIDDISFGKPVTAE